MDITDIVAGGFFFGLSNRPFYITTGDRIEPPWLFSCLDCLLNTDHSTVLNFLS